MKKKIILHSLCIIFLFFPASFVNGSISTSTHAVAVGVTTISTSSPSSHQDLEISRDGTYVYASSFNENPYNYLYQYDTSEMNRNYASMIREEWKYSTGGIGNINSLSVSDDGEVVIYAEVFYSSPETNNELVCVEEDKQEKFVYGSGEGIDEVTNVEVSGDGNYYMYVYYDSGLRVRFASIGTGTICVLTFGSVYCNAIQIAQDGSYGVIGLNNGTVFCYSNTGQLLWRDTPINDNIRSIEISENKEFIAINANQGKRVYLYDSDGTLLQTYDPSLDKRTTLLGISSDGERVLVSSTNGSSGVINLYGQSSNTPIWSITTPNYPITAGSMSSDGTLAACAGFGSRGRFYLIDCTNGAFLTNESIFLEYPDEAEISKDGSTAAIIGYEGAIFIYKIIDGNIFSGLFDPFNFIFMGISLGLGFLIALIILKKKS